MSEPGSVPRVLPSASGPTPPDARILSLDVLRGVAVLGILLINIQNFSMIATASLNPMAWGDLTGPNLWIFMVSHVLADQEFLTLFAMLFAAGLLFTADRLEPGGRSVMGLHYRRVAALLAIGAAHAYLLWENDILFEFAQCGLLIYPLRRLGPRTLFAVGLGLYAVYSGLVLWQGLQFPDWPPMLRSVLQAGWEGDPRVVAHEVAALRGPWLDQVAFRAPEVVYTHTTRFLVWTLWRIGGVMLMGMALYRWGVLTGVRSRPFYIALALLGLGVGLGLRGTGMASDFAAGWSMEYSRYFGFQYRYWGSLCLALGYLGAVTLLVQSGLVPRALRALAAVGRLSLTNYLMQSLICTTVFYGHGLGWHSQLERTGQLAIVLAIWAFQIAFSVLWTRRFAYGPVESLWRAVTYLSLRPATIR